MARNFSVGDLVTRMRKIGDWENLDADYSEAGSYMDSGTLIGFLDQAHAYAWDLYADADEGWNMTRSTVTLSGGSGSVPSDMGKLRMVQVADGDGWRPLSRATSDDDSVGTGWVGGALSCRLVGDSIEVVPQDGTTSVRLTYTPVAPVLSSSLQTVDGVDGYDQVVVLRACILGRIREEKDYRDLQQQLGEYEARMRQSIQRRDRGVPAHTRDRRDSTPYGGLWRRR